MENTVAAFHLSELQKEADQLSISICKVGPFWCGIWNKRIIARELSENLCLERAIAKRKGLSR